ncbi:aminotransferase class V-fold PLP-dependent enzyme [Maritalea sp.]|uniref:aminotransferase class V-fold PLP-dependent enzyme n=1 Tax=Maritalea sp. TaxID=2003361 RepID=UPI003EF7D23A
MFEQFKSQLVSDNLIGELRGGLIGDGISIPGPFGAKKLVYADYVASARALRQIEDFIANNVLPYYANSHTRSSYCGAYMTQMRELAREEIAKSIGASEDYSVVFTGAGATAAVNRLVKILGVENAVRSGIKPVVFIGPYEHHSNILPWRETGAQVVIIPEAEEGGPDLEVLKAELANHQSCSLKIGSFSAASNVTGIVTDVAAVTRVLKQNQALAIWDYAGGAPYLPISVKAEEVELDAMFLSTHKFPGGPAASGILVVRDKLSASNCPSWPGGGTVTYVSPWNHDYVSSLSSREEAGTPNVIGDIRAALCFMVKDAIGADLLAQRQKELKERAFNAWQNHDRINILGHQTAERLPIFSFQIMDNDGELIHHQHFTRMLSDMYGIQARGGCACAGPYGHELLAIDADQSAVMRDEIKQGNALARPGWVRLNFSYLLDDEKANFIIESVAELANSAGKYIDDYVFVKATGSYIHQSELALSDELKAAVC